MNPVVVRRMRGGTVLGFLVGLIAGLSIAVVVAMIVTRAPVPFVDKGNRTTEPALEPKSLSEAPDPNAPLHAKARPAEAATTPAAPASPSLAVAPPSAPIIASAPSAAPGAGIAPDTQGDASYLLQAGAFRSSSEAESMKARLALIGFEARVLDAQVNGQTLYRVRVGPYAQLDSMNRARARLAENGIEASVVRQR
ncbi:MAG: SPOR domain-containing protein [Burkholderiaceae bacterium]|nr:SPOR domain-containing protein [Burkholderiaceae bacterium]